MKKGPNVYFWSFPSSNNSYKDMIDYIKLKLYNISSNKLIANPQITWNQGFDPTTGKVIKYPVRGQFHNCKIVITGNQIILKGSLHILWNNILSKENQNWDDFNYKDLSELIFWLKTNIGIDPKKSIIQNLEYGVNVGIWKNPTDLIIENVIVWDGKVHSKNFSFDNKGKFVEWVFEQYSQKIYNKGQQYKRDNYILRWEKKAVKSEYLKKFELKVLSDLLDANKLELLRYDLLKSFDKLIVVDTLEPTVKFDKRDQRIWNKGTNPKTWENLKYKHRSQKSRLNKNFSQVLRKNGLDKTHFELRNRIDKKISELIGCNDLTDLEEPHLNAEEYENATNLHLDNMSECCTSKEQLYLVYCGPKPNKYRRRDPKTIPLSDYPEIKRIRNIKSNPRNNVRRKYLKLWCNRQGSLFPDYPIDMPRFEYELLNHWKGTKWDILPILNFRIVS